MHAELLDMVFTGTASALLVVGGIAALAALPWREADLIASDRAMAGAIAGAAGWLQAEFQRAFANATEAPLAVRRVRAR